MDRKFRSWIGSSDELKNSPKEIILERVLRAENWMEIACRHVEHLDSSVTRHKQQYITIVT